MIRPYFTSPLAFRQFLANLKAAPRELPDEDDPLVLRLEAKLRKHFRAQHGAVLASLGRKKAPLDLPDRFIPLDSWDREMFVDARPIIELWMSRSSGEFLTRIGASPEVWAVVSPKLREAVDSLTLTFCQATNDTTSQNLNDALAKLREEIDTNLFKGEPLPELTKRVNRIFDGAETWRAKRIAATEASRSVHKAERIAGKESGVVSKWRWLASADACDFCRGLNNMEKADDEPFAEVDSKFPEYRLIFHPPGHPGCQCSVVAVIDEAALAPGISMDELLRARRELVGAGV